MTATIEVRYEPPDENAIAGLTSAARVYFDAGNLAQADIICRYLENCGAASAQTADMLAAIADALGPVAAPQSGNGDRYLLIKAWRAGFWSDVDHVLGQLLIAELTNRIPVTQWGGAFRYTDDPKKDAFRAFFAPVSDLTVADLKDVEGPFYPPPWTPETLHLEIDRNATHPAPMVSGLRFLNRPERLVVGDYMTRICDVRPWIPPAHPLSGYTVKALYRYLIDKWLRPAPAMRAVIDRFVADTIPHGPPTLAVHYRGTDKRREYGGLGELDYVTDIKINEFLERHADGRVFVLTDDDAYLTTIRGLHPGKIVAQNCARGSGEMGLHFRNWPSRERLGREIMIDTYAALAANRFFGISPSNVSAMIAVLKPWPADSCELLLPSALEHPNLTIYDDRDLARRFTPNRMATVIASGDILKKVKARWRQRNSGAENG